MKRWIELNFSKQRNYRDKKFNLLIVGAQKAGTTSLHYALNQHPDIFMTHPIKEPGFFLPFDTVKDYFAKKNIQLKNKQHFFENYLLKGYKGEKYLGESSTFYTTLEWSSKKLVFNILKYNCKIKIIYICRDKVDRIISNFFHELEKNKNLKFSDFLENKEAFEISCYNKRILPFKQLIDNENIITLKFEELVNKPNEIMKQIFSFLKLNNDIKDLNFPKLNKKGTSNFDVKQFKEQILQHRYFKKLQEDDQFFMYVA